MWKRIIRHPKIILTLGMLAFVALWLTAHHKPGWYQPAVLGEPALQRARKHAIATTDWISGQIVRGRPFEFVLHDQIVNEWLAALHTLWPEAKDILPSEMTNLAVGFDDGLIHIGCHYRGRWWQAIVSLGLVVNLSRDERSVEFVLGPVRGGALPVPRSIVHKLLDPLLYAVGHRRGQPAESELPARSSPRDAGSIDRVFDGITIENRFVWFNGHRPFRISAITIRNRELHLWIEPL